MAGIDERHQLLGPAIARIGSVVTGHRLTGFPEPQFDVSKFLIEQMRQDDFLQLGVGGDPLRSAGGTLAERDWVNGDRQFPAGRFHGSRHPGTVAPIVTALDVADQGRRLGINLRMKGQRVGLEKDRAFPVADFVFVEFAQPETGNEQLPYPGLVSLQRMPAAVPLVEGADHADPAGVGCPEREIDTHDAFLDPQMRAQLGEQGVEHAPLECLTIGLGKGRFVNGVGIVEGGDLTAGIDGHEPVLQFCDSRNANGEQAVRMQPLHFALAGTVPRQHVGALGLWQKGADHQHPLPLGIVGSQNRVRCVVTQFDDFSNMFFQHRPYLLI